MHIKTKRRRIALVVSLVSLIVAILVGSIILPVHGEEKIYDAVVRLHVLANSDSEQDQALKMKVRDAVLEVTSTALEGCSNQAEAAERLEELIPTLTEVAVQTLRQNGSEDDVTITLSEEEYPTRNYESFCFPAGKYVSLRIMIGQAEGQNFWCVLFPSLCSSAATVTREQAEEEFISVGLSRDQYAIITETQNTKYKLRFKFLETLQGWFR